MAIRRVSDADVQEMARLYTGGYTSYEIGTRFAVDNTTVQYHLKKSGVQLRSKSETQRKYTLREGAFTTVRDEPTAYWLGFLFADGCVHVRRNDTEKGLHLALQSQDVSHLHTFAAFMGSNSPVKQEASSDAYSIHLYSGRLVDDLIQLGCTPNKSNAMFLSPPPLSNDLFPHFVRGYFDGDGSAFVGDDVPTITLCGNPNFLTILQGRIMMHTQIDGVVREHSVSKQVCYLWFRGKGKCTALGEWLYKDATVFLSRKRERIASFPPYKRVK